MLPTKNAHSTQGVSLSYNIFHSLLQCLEEHDGIGGWICNGIEPGTNYPNSRSYEGEQGRVIKLDPNGTADLSLKMQFLTDERQVADSEKRIATLQENGVPTISNLKKVGVPRKNRR